MRVRTIMRACTKLWRNPIVKIADTRSEAGHETYVYVLLTCYYRLSANYMSIREEFEDHY